MNVRQSQERLIRIAQCVENKKPLSEDDCEFISLALNNIGDGVDANVALGVKSERGRRKGNHAKIAFTNKRHALGWVAAAIMPEESAGLGMTVEEACAAAAATGVFGLTEEVIKKYWYANIDQHDPWMAFTDNEFDKWKIAKQINGDARQLTAQDIERLNLIS